MIPPRASHDLPKREDRDRMQNLPYRQACRVHPATDDWNATSAIWFLPRERIAQCPAIMEVASVEIVGRSRKSSWFSEVTCLFEGEIHHRGSRHNMQVRPPHATAKPRRRPSQSPGATEPGSATAATRTIRTIVLEQGFEGARLNTGTISDLQNLAATVLANFTTVRIPRCESLWTCLIPDPSPKHLHRLRSRALTRETFIMNCHRRHLQHRLLERGHRAFFDRIEGGGPMAAALLLPRPCGHQRIVRRRGRNVRSWQCREFRC